MLRLARPRYPVFVGVAPGSSTSCPWLQLRCSSGQSESPSPDLVKQLEHVASELHTLQEVLRGTSPETRQLLATAALRSSSEACLSRSLDEPTAMEKFVAQLSNTEVRALTIAAMSRHFGKDFRTEFDAIDSDRSGTLDRGEFKRYLTRVLPTLQQVDASRPSNRQLALFALNSAIPFVVFGFLDNSIMILGGDIVDDLIGSWLHLSTLACAAVANTFADVIGISIGNSVEALTVRLGLPEAALTAAQAELPLVRRLGVASGSLGILVGCIMGMTPLLFVDEEKKRVKEAFARVDVDDKGSLEPAELRKVFATLGMHDVDELQLGAALQEVGLGHQSRISQKDFLEKAAKLKELLTPEKK